jgi:multiple sugar transport system permease protein
MFKADERFFSAVKATLYYVLVSVPLKIAFALVVALLLNRSARIFNLYRSVYYLPSLVGGSIAISMMWKELFATNGIINSILGALGLPARTPWLGSPNLAVWVLILLTVWQFGSSMIIFAAGLKQIPHTYYEAAEIDGASNLKSFAYITLPALSPVIFFNIIMQIIFSFMAFTQAYIITGGGPLDSTLFYALYVYQKAIQYREMGYGCAMSWVLLLMIGLLTAVVFKSSSYWVFYESAKD